VYGLAWLFLMECKVTHAAHDVRGQLTIASGSGEIECALEVLFGCCVAACIVGHPAGHLRQGASGGEHALLVAATSTSEEAWANRILEIAKHSGVKVTATDLTVRRTKRLHGSKV
jgi:hypothetical protein